MKRYAFATQLALTMPLLILPALPTSAQTAAPPTGAAPAANQLDEITVTARKRTESAQDVPVSITAFSPSTLENAQVISVTDLSAIVPNMVLKQNPTTTISTSMYIRGVGQDESQFTSENSVGLYIDGIYFPRAAGALVDLLDYQSVEVDRGPQGTLFGKNSPGGAVVFTSNPPVLNQKSAEASVTVGNYNTINETFTGNLPLGDNAAVRLSYGGRDNSGWMHDGISNTNLNGTDKQSGRLSLLYQPTDSLRVQVIGDYSHDGSQPYAPTYVVGRTPVDGLYTTYIQPQFDHPQIFYGRGIEAIVEDSLSDAISVKSVSGFRSFSHQLWGDLFGAPDFSVGLYRHLEQYQYSEEVQSNITLGKFSAVVGAIYFYEDNKEHAYNEFAGGADSYPISNQKSSSYAGYTEGTYSFTDWVSMTAGGRYGVDNKEMTRKATSLPDGAGLVAYDVDGQKASDYEFTPRVIVDFKPLKAMNYTTDNSLLLYTSFSKGYRALAWDPAYSGNQSLATVILPPEKVATPEVGFKSELFDQRLKFNADYFIEYYTHYQNHNCSFGAVSICTPASFNVHLSGTEVELSARPLAGLTLTANAATLYNNIVDGPNVGQQMRNAPKFTYYWSADYVHKLYRDFRGIAGVSYKYTSSYVNDLSDAPEAKTDQYHLIDLYAGIGPDEGSWELRGYVRNLSNAAPIVNALGGGSWWIGQPRTFGATLKMRF